MPHQQRRGSARLLLLLAPAALILSAWWWFDAGNLTSASTPFIDIEGIEASAERRYEDASAQTLMWAHRNLSEREPKVITRLHEARIDQGDFVLLDVPQHTAGAPVEYPRVTQPDNAHGLVRVHLLSDGRYVKTQLNLEDIGGAASWAIEMAWLDRRLNEVR